MLKPGLQADLQGGGGKLVITVLAQDRDGRQRGDAESWKSANGRVPTSSRCRETTSRSTKSGDVYYAGEDVDA